MSHCPCCANQLLRRIRNGQVHWFCRSCWQEMPLVELSCRLDETVLGVASRHSAIHSVAASAHASNAIVPVVHLSRRSA